MYSNKFKENSPLLKKDKSLKTKAFLLAFLSSFLMFLPFLIIQGGYFTYFGDFTSQTVVFNSQCNDLIKNGQTSWCWWNNAGTDFVEAFSYYTLGSPFFYITLLFPADLIPYLLVPIMSLKIGLASLFAYIYMQQYVKNNYSALIGAVLYALSGWTIYNLFFYTFLDALIFFPLIIYSLDRFILENERGLLCFTVALCAFDNYYFLFQIGLFTIIYFLVKIIKKEFVFSFKVFFNLVFEVVIGILISAVLLLPSIINILQMPRLNTSNSLENNLWFSEIIKSFIRKIEEYYGIICGFIFPSITPGLHPVLTEGSFKWLSASYGLPMFSVIGVIAFIKKKKKHWLSTIIIISFVFMFIPILCSLFNMLSATYMRWTFMPVLFMAMASALVLEEKEFSLKKITIGVGVLLIVMSVLPFIFPQKAENTFETFGELNWYTIHWVFICVIAIIALILLVLIIKNRRINYRKFSKQFIACSCAIFVLSGILSIRFGTQTIHEYSTYPVEQYIEADIDFDDSSQNYRISTETQFYNLPQLLGYQSTENFQTFISNSTTEFYLYLGYNIGGVYSYYNNNAVKTFLSNKYYITDEYGYFDCDNSASNYKVTTVDKEGDLNLFGYSEIGNQSKYKLYENNYYIPYGFTYDSYYLLNETEGLTMNQKSQLLLKGIMLTKEQERKYSNILNKLDLTSITDDYSDMSYALDCKRILSRNIAENFKITESGFECSYSSNKDNLLFFSVPYHNGWKAYINGKGVDIEKVNAGFIAIEVSKGENEIVFKYENPSVKAGVFISVFAFLIYIVYIIILLSFKMKKRHQI